MASFKASKTLSGIETNFTQGTILTSVASKPLKPFQGLKQQVAARVFMPLRSPRFKASKTLSGIETGLGKIVVGSEEGFKASKTLSGIETYQSDSCQS